MADKPAPEDDTYSDKVAARRTEATIRAMIGMKPKPQKSPAPKAKTRPASKQPVDKRKSGA